MALTNAEQRRARWEYWHSSSRGRHYPFDASLVATNLISASARSFAVSEPESLGVSQPDVDLMRQIDAVCRRFEADYRAGKSPVIADCLDEIPEVGRPALQSELIGLEQEMRRSDRTRPQLDSDLIVDVPTIAPVSLAAAPIPGPANPAVHDVVTVPPRDQATVEVGSFAPALPDESAPGRVRYFGDYEIERELARGGMGVVFRARQVSLNRPVALKMILAGQLADDTDVKRFYTEAEAAANLDHSGIVPIYEVGQHEGQHYFSMGFVEGQSLSHRLADGLFPPREAAELIRRVSEAIEFAHQHGVIHRDLKPANILLDKNGNPRVTDFGLAKKIESDSGLTGSGQIMGTPSYMPPEQAGGKRGEVGPTADVYSLGATLYALVTGRPPFQAATAMDTVIQVLSDEPIPPRRLNPSIPPDLETICTKCLEKDPARRYASARALAEELGRFLAGEPIVARPVTARERVLKWARRRPTIAGLIAAVALVSLIGVTGITWQWRAAVTARRESARLATGLVFDRAVDRGMRDDPNDGMLWLARGLEIAPDESFQKLFRLNLDGWSRELTALELALPPGDKANDIAFSADGRRVVRSQGQTARIWSVADGRPIGPPLEHRGWVSHAAFSSNGHTLVTAARDGSARVWDAETGMPRGEPLSHAGFPWALALAPDGQHLALAAGPPPNSKPSPPPSVVCHVWDLATRRKVAIELPRPEGKPTLIFRAPGTDDIRALAFDGAGKTLAVAAHGFSGGRVWLWDVASTQFAPPVETETGVTSLASLGESDFLVALSGKKIARICRTAAGSTLQVGGKRPFTAFSVAVDGTRPPPWALLGLADHTARLMRLDGGNSFAIEQERAVLWHSRIVLQMAFAPDGRTLLTSDGTARRWRRAPGQALGPPVPETGMADVARSWTSDDGHRVLVGARDGTYRLLDGPTGRPIGGPMPIPPPGDTREIPPAVVFSADGRRMAICWVRRKPAPQAGIPTMRQILDTELQTWDSVTAAPLGPKISIGETLSARGETPIRFSFSPNGGRLLLRTMHPPDILDAATLRPDAVLGPIPGRTRGRFCDASFSPDGRWLLTLSIASPDAAVYEPDSFQLWDIATGRAAGESTASDGPITSVVFSPSGSRVATCHRIRGQTATNSRWVTRVWDLPTCRPIGTLIDQAMPSTFSADGSILLTGYHQDIRLWEIPSCRPLGGPFRLLQTAGASVRLSRDSAALFSPVGRLLAIGTDDHYAQLIDAHSGRPMSPQLPHSDAVVALAFSANGDLLLAGSADGTARFWHVGTGRPVGPPLAHSGRRVDRVAFTPDSRSAVTWSRASDTCTIVRHWAVPEPWSGDFAEVRGRVELMTNRRLGADDIARPLSDEEWHAKTLDLSSEAQNRSR
jgi:WD40 repeat protein